MHSLDVRSGRMSQAKLWSSSSAFATRAHFRTTTHPAQLLIDNIQLRDEGLYRCRVDFRNSPTRNARVNFTVIEPPERPVILDDRDGLPTKLIEPYNEGSAVSLTCEVTGGEWRSINY